MSYKSTVKAAFTGYIVLAVVNNFLPLLFLTLQKSYSLSLSEITFLITLNFLVQIATDVASSSFIDKIGYRASMVLAHVFSMLGFFMLSFLPDIFPGHYGGIIISTVFYAIGGGLLEVLVSPVVEACPTDNKEKEMSLLHSFYCWGHVGVVILSTLYFSLFGILNWKYLAFLWGLLPLVNGIIFTKVPIKHLIEGEENGMTLGELLKTKMFLIMLLLMVCAGASEQAVSQWTSTFAEIEAGIPKEWCDMAGPLTFAVMMGISRLIYGKFGDKLNLEKFIFVNTCICIISYIVIALSPIGAISLMGAAVTGFCVGIMWPGTFSIASAAIRRGGTVMFAFLALFGDVGCMAGPTFAGFMSSLAGGNLRVGILLSIIFPILMLLGYRLYLKEKKKL